MRFMVICVHGDLGRITAAESLFRPAPSALSGRGLHWPHLMSGTCLSEGSSKNIAALTEGGTPPACQSGCQANPPHLCALTSSSILVSPVDLNAWPYKDLCIENKQTLMCLCGGYQCFLT